MLTPHITEEAFLSEHFYSSLEDPKSPLRGLVLVPLFVIGFLLPIALFNNLVLLCTIIALIVALTTFGVSWILRRMRLQEALRILEWLRSMPFSLDGYLDALNFEPLRDRYFYIRAELKPLKEGQMPTPDSLREFINARLKTVRVRYQLGDKLTIVLTSSRLSTREYTDSANRSNIDCHRWLRSCLRDVLLPLHEKYPLQRVMVYHQNA